MEEPGNRIQPVERRAYHEKDSGKPHKYSPCDSVYPEPDKIRKGSKPMKRNYREYHEKAKTPKGYELLVSEIRDVADQMGVQLTDEIMYTLSGFYKYAFDRGRRAEADKIKKDARP